MALICGIDEAGRGPVIGPLVICGVLIEQDKETELKKIKVKDSKLLTKEQREILFDQIKKAIKGYKLIIIQPEEIDRAVKKHDGLNLNLLEGKKAAEIINHLNPDIAIIDCPSPNLRAFTHYLKTHVKKNIELQCAHKAESKYPAVAAASILAKVTRDREIEKIQKTIKEPLGSGYASDPITVKFLEKNYDIYPEIFRHSWLPYKDALEKKFQRTLKEFDQFIKKEEKTITKHDLEKLKPYGYEFVKPKSEHEAVRMKGRATVIIYKNGKLLIQGNEQSKKLVEKMLGL